MARSNTKRVRIEELFLWRHELGIRDHNGDVVLKVYQRVVNDIDHDKARLAALRESRKIRLALRNPQTDEHCAMMESLERYSVADIVNIILLDKVDTYYQTAREEAKTNMPKRLNSKASQEDVENYEAEIDGYDEKLNKEVLSIVERLSTADKEKLDVLGEPELRKLVLVTLENQICVNIFSNHIGDRLAWLGTYRDSRHKTRYFGTFEEFEELAGEVKKQLVQGYKEITMGSEDLKN